MVSDVLLELPQLYSRQTHHRTGAKTKRGMYGWCGGGVGCGVPKREFWSSSVVPQHFRRLKMPYAHHARKIQAARCLRMLMLVATYSFLAGVDLRGADLDSQCDFTPPIVHSATEYAQGATTHDPARRLTTLESCFQRFNKAECEVHFRFEQHELTQLYDSLGFPPSVRLGEREVILFTPNYKASF